MSQKNQPKQNLKPAVVTPPAVAEEATTGAVSETVTEQVMQQPEPQAPVKPVITSPEPPADIYRALLDAAQKLANDGYPGPATLCSSVIEYAKEMRRPGPTSETVGRLQQQRLWAALVHTLDYTSAEVASLTLTTVLHAMHQDVQAHGLERSAFTERTIMRYPVIASLTAKERGAYTKIMSLLAKLAVVGPHKRLDVKRMIVLDPLYRELTPNAAAVIRNFFDGI